MPVPTQTRTQWHERARSRTQQGARAPLSPLARLLTSSGNLSGRCCRAVSGCAGCRSEVWIAAPVGVRGTRGRCAAFRSVQDAGDSPSPRCWKSELSSASAADNKRHLLRTVTVSDALWLLICWIRWKRVHARYSPASFGITELTGSRGAHEDFLSPSPLPHAFVNYDTVWERRAPGGSSWSSPTFTRITFSFARK